MHCPKLQQLPSTEKTGWPWAEETLQASSTMEKGNPWPKISIVTPSFNQGKFIEETIRSVLLQGYPNLEYIIIDGGSTDNSIEIIKNYEPWIAYWESEPDKGQSHAINKGFAKATGEIYGWLNSDDFFLSGGLCAIAQFANNKPEAIAWVGACYDIDKDGKEIRLNIPKIGGKKALADWSQGAFFPQPGCLFKAEAFHRIGGLNESLFYVLDVELWMRLADIGKFANFEQAIAVSRLHEEAKTFLDLPEREVEHMRINYLLGAEDVSGKRLLRFAERYALRYFQHTIKDASIYELFSLATKWAKNWIKRKLKI